MIRDVIFPNDLTELKKLIHEYVDWLNLDLSYQDCEGEMENIESLFTLPHGQYTLAICNSEVAGGVGFKHFSNGVAEIKRLYVRPKYQGQGIGYKLVENLIRKLKKLGYKKLVLDAVPPTSKAQELYKSMGFQEIEPYFHNPIENTKYYGYSL